jgi:hypothetical protein
MKKLYLTSVALVEDAQRLADNLAEYNPGLSKEKVPLENIQYDLACLGEDLIRLYSKIERKIKKD